MVHWEGENQGKGPIRNNYMYFSSNGSFVLIRAACQLHELNQQLLTLTALQSRLEHFFKMLMYFAQTSQSLLNEIFLLWKFKHADLLYPCPLALKCFQHLKKNVLLKYIKEEQYTIFHSNERKNMYFPSQGIRKLCENQK